MKRFLVTISAVVCAATMSATNYTVFDIENAGEWGGDAKGWGQTVKFDDKSFKVTSVKAGCDVDLVAPNTNPYAWRVYKSSEVNIEATGASIKQITITYDNYDSNRYVNEMTLSEGWTGSIANAVYTLMSAGLNKLNATATNGQVRIRQIIVSDQIDDTSEALHPSSQEAISVETSPDDPDDPEPRVLEIDGTKYRINEDNPTSVTITSLPKIVGDTLVVPDRVEYDGNTFIVSNIDWGNCYTGIKVSHAIIPNTVKNIGDFAFYDTRTLKSIELGNSVERIGYDSFSQSGIESIILPNSVIELDVGAFLNAKNLKKVTLGSNVKTLKWVCFGQCDSLEEIICYADEPPYQELECFRQVSHDVLVQVPTSSVDKYKSDYAWSYFYNIVGCDYEPMMLDKAYIQMSVGQSNLITVVKGNGSVRWESSDPNVATVENGRVNAINFGSTVITATDDTGDQASCNVYVNIPITDVVVDSKKICLYKGESTEAFAYILPENADIKFIWWESKDPNIVELETDNFGKVTIKGLNIGKTTITAKSWDGVSSDIEVEVMIPVIRLKIEGLNESSFVVTAIKGGECLVEFLPLPNWEIYSVSLDGCDITDRIKDNLVDISGIESDGCLNFVFRQSQTGINETQSNVKLYVVGNTLTMENLELKSSVVIYSLDGMLIDSIIPRSSTIKVNLNHGTYIIKYDNNAYRVIM